MLAQSLSEVAHKPQSRPQTEAVVGPNAILQLTAALRLHCGDAVEKQVISSADLERYAEAPPTELVAERDAARLFAETRLALPAAAADAVLSTAGSLTADYILAHRIPRKAQQFLQCMPSWLAVRMLLSAIKAHAWTFAGSGIVTIDVGLHPNLTISANPLATPGCPWHVAVLQRLFERIATPWARIRYARTGLDDLFYVEAVPPDRGRMHLR